MSNMAFTVYKSATGRIDFAGAVSVVSDDEDAFDIVLAQAGAGESILVGVEGDNATEMVDLATQTLKPRPSLDVPGTKSLAAGASWVIPGVPDGTAVTDDGFEMGVTSGGLTRIFTNPGVYDMRLVPPWPHQSARCLVTVI